VRIAPIFLAAIATGLFIIPGIGQTGNQEPARGAESNAAGSPARMVDLNLLVLDKEKHPLIKLDRAAFQVFENGAPQTIQSVSGEDGPVSLCLLIDESGSTKAMRDPIGDAVVSLVKNLPAGSEVMLVRFADAAYLDLPFTPASSVEPAKLRQLNSRGGTALFDALIAAEDYVQKNAHQNRRALVVISDGGENASTVSLLQTTQRVLMPGAPMLYALSTRDEKAYPAEKIRDERRLTILAKVSGGMILSARNANDMAHGTDQISAMIRSQVVLSYASTDPVRDRRFRKLEVRIQPLDKQTEIHVSTGYYALEASAGGSAK
jgi:Ca-activated chloride channel family protein